MKVLPTIWSGVGVAMTTRGSSSSGLPRVMPSVTGAPRTVRVALPSIVKVTLSAALSVADQISAWTAIGPLSASYPARWSVRCLPLRSMVTLLPDLRTDARAVSGNGLSALPVTAGLPVRAALTAASAFLLGSPWTTRASG